MQGIIILCSAGETNIVVCSGQMQQPPSVNPFQQASMGQFNQLMQGSVNQDQSQRQRVIGFMGPKFRGSIVQTGRGSIVQTGTLLQGIPRHTGPNLKQALDQLGFCTQGGANNIRPNMQVNTGPRLPGNRLGHGQIRPPRQSNLPTNSHGLQQNFSGVRSFSQNVQSQVGQQRQPCPNTVQSMQQQQQQQQSGMYARLNNDDHMYANANPAFRTDAHNQAFKRSESVHPELTAAQPQFNNANGPPPPYTYAATQFRNQPSNSWTYQPANSMLPPNQSNTMHYPRMPQPAHQQQPSTVQFHRPQMPPMCPHNNQVQSQPENLPFINQQGPEFRVSTSLPNAAVTSQPQFYQNQQQSSGFTIQQNTVIYSSNQNQAQQRPNDPVAKLARILSLPANQEIVQRIMQRREIHKKKQQYQTESDTRSRHVSSDSFVDSSTTKSQFERVQTGASDRAFVDKEIMSRWYTQPSENNSNINVTTEQEDKILRKNTSGSLLAQMLLEKVPQNPCPVAAAELFVLRPTVCNEHVIEYKVKDLLRCLPSTLRKVKQPTTSSLAPGNTDNAASLSGGAGTLQSDFSQKEGDVLPSEITQKECGAIQTENTQKKENLKSQILASHVEEKKQQPPENIKKINNNNNDNKKKNNVSATDKSSELADPLEQLDPAFLSGSILDENRKRLFDELTMNVPFVSQDMEIDYRQFMPATPLPVERPPTPVEPTESRPKIPGVTDTSETSHESGNVNEPSMDTLSNEIEPTTEELKLPPPRPDFLDQSKQSQQNGKTWLSSDNTDVSQAALSPPRVEVETDEIVPELQFAAIMDQRPKSAEPVSDRSAMPTQKRRSAEFNDRQSEFDAEKQGKGKQPAVKQIRKSKSVDSGKCNPDGNRQGEATKMITNKRKTSEAAAGEPPQKKVKAKGFAGRGQRKTVQKGKGKTLIFSMSKHEEFIVILFHFLMVCRVWRSF